MAKYRVGDPIWTESRRGDIGFITHVFPYSGVVYAKFMQDKPRLSRVPFDEIRIPLSFNGIIPMDQASLEEVPELGASFFVDAILTQPGESVIDKLQSERKR